MGHTNEVTVSYRDSINQKQTGSYFEAGFRFSAFNHKIFVSVATNEI